MRKVIYTCIFGGYDALRQPLAVSPDWDYVCFTDNPGTGKEGVWSLREVSWPAAGVEATPAAMSRYPKLRPDEVFPDYDISLYMDPNIRIVDSAFYQTVEGVIDSGAEWAGVRHGRRDCIYQEVKACYNSGHIRWRDAFRMARRLRRSSFPKKAGLFENNIILRVHNLPGVVKVDQAWWGAYLTGPGRDQLHLMPALCGSGIQVSELLPDGMNARNCTWLEYSPHFKAYVPPFPRPRAVRNFLSKFL